MRVDDRSAGATRLARRLGISVCAAALACAGGLAPAREAPTPGRPDTGFHVIAHRGGAGHAPENTLPAFRRSLADGVIEVELDVRLSLDEVLVLFHDHTLEHKTGHEGSVGVYTAAELTRFDIGSWFDREHPEAAESFAGTPIVTLSDLFGEFGARLYYHLEIKGEDPRVPGLLRRAIDAAGLAARTSVTSFSFAQVALFRSFGADIPVCWLMQRNRDLRDSADRAADLLARQHAQVDTAKRSGFAGVAVPADEIGAPIVDYAHSAGIGIRAWGVKSPEDERRVIASGSDGATTDWPQRLRDRLSD